MVPVQKIIDIKLQMKEFKSMYSIVSISFYEELQSYREVSWENKTITIAQNLVFQIKNL